MTLPEFDPIRQRLAVQDAIVELFLATDSKDWERVQSVFAPRVLFDMSSLGGGEPSEVAAEAIAEGWAEGLASVPEVHHQVGNFVIDVTGDSAEVFCYGIAMHIKPEETNPLTTFVGSYEFRLRRIENRWRIEGFRFIKKYVG